MKIPAPKWVHRQPACSKGFLQIDLVAALAILAVAIVPMGYTFAHERQLLRIEYQRSVADEIVDGEMEILAAGKWDTVPDGSQIYPVTSPAAANLPPGHFQLTKSNRQLQLEWLPDEKHGLGKISREITLK